ncbi:MAG: 6,7-dimethyl-8-ribityllumazine synthase [Bacteroidetes bacterium]|jgi:6,7-dimethyl-8-ribityllumazine synthase|nr:6,7-dimethyl-8-ribityllumazine synthase [Bacteroidota bacterium]
MATAGHNLSNYDKSNLPNGARFRVGIVVSKWNESITSGLLDGALEVLHAAGVPEDQCVVQSVPGAFELPMACQWMLESSPEVDAVIAIGAVVRGETAHFDFVCQAASMGILRAGMDSGKPTIFCVLTDDNMDQSIARSGGALGNKGIEAAVACLEMLALKHRIFPS